MGVGVAQPTPPPLGGGPDPALLPAHSKPWPGTSSPNARLSAEGLNNARNRSFFLHPSRRQKRDNLCQWCARHRVAFHSTPSFCPVCGPPISPPGPYSRDLLPLIHADESDVRSMLSEVIFLGNKLIISSQRGPTAGPLGR